MRSPRLTATLCAVVVITTLAACSSTTDGAGTGPSPTSAAPTSSGPSPTPTPTTSAPTTSAPASSSPPSSAASTKPTSSLHPAPASPLRVIHVSAADGASYVVDVWAQSTVTNCAQHAYGAPVIAFLTAHPCIGVQRTLATTTQGGRAVGIAASNIGFQGQAPTVYEVAGQFDTLVTAEGTGSLNDLLLEGYRLPSGPTSIPQSEAFNALGQDNSVTVFDAWYLSGTTPINDPALVAMEQDLFLQY